MTQETASGDIDEFIEYELTKSCNEQENDLEYEQQGYIDIEMLEEDFEDNDVKPVIVEEIEEIIPGGDCDFIVEGAEEQSEQQNTYVDQAELTDINDYHEPEEEKVFDEPEEEKVFENTLVTIKEEKKERKSCEGGEPVKRYLLFDDLVATIVDFDGDNTPIVEFSLARNDTDEKLPVECGICPDVMNKSRLVKHLTTHLVPGTTNRYQCIYCEESYKDYKYLAGHARRHMGIRPYVCEICKLYFSTKQDMRVHNQRRHLEKEHICEICGKTFAQNTQLKRHRESTHEKKRRFQCEYCPKAYYKNFSLKEHVRNVHLGKRRMLVCPFCGMQCRDAHKMARHRREMHLNQSNYICEICNEEFTEIQYFDAHKRSIQCRNNTKRFKEDQGLIDDGEDDEIVLSDDPQGVQYVLHQQQEGNQEVVVYDQMGQIIVEQVDNNPPTTVLNEIDDDNEHFLQPHMTEHIIPDTHADFIYEVTLETQD